MKILYAIQGTGNGHISRARDIIPLLQERGELDILISGTEADVELGFPVKYTLKGLSFVFGKKGGVDLVSTYKKAKIKRFYTEIRELPVNEYDLVISDFEPVSAWACRLYRKPCFALSHQWAVLNKKSPHPKSLDPVGKAILKNYAPVTAGFGFHFEGYGKRIFTPVIREEIRTITTAEHGHYTVYLPSYSDKKIIKVLGRLPGIEWQVFSKHSKKVYRKENIIIVPVTNKAFVKSMAFSAGVLCGAGFETPSEALFLGKKLMVVPMKHQYEQQCNATALKRMEVPVLKKLNVQKVEKIKSWVSDGKVVPVSYPDITIKIIDALFDQYKAFIEKQAPKEVSSPYPFKKLQKILRDKLLNNLTK